MCTWWAGRRLGAEGVTHSVVRFKILRVINTFELDRVEGCARRGCRKHHTSESGRYTVERGQRKPQGVECH